VGWWVLAQALVWAVVVEVAHVLVENGAGVLFVVDQHAVGAFGADAADEPFRVAVRLGCARRDLDDGDGFGAEHGIEGFGEFRVPVADQKVESAELITEVHQEVPGGLGSPGRGRVRGHPEEMDLSGADFHGQVGPGCGAGVATGPFPGACMVPNSTQALDQVFLQLSRLLAGTP
jgi:hypothetical protein